MQKHIEWSDVESIQLFSGFRGSGKTTELFRLQKQLEEEGYVVIYANALDYVSPSEEVDISNLLIVFAGAFSDGLKSQLEIDIAEESFWVRFTSYLTKTNIEISELGAGVAEAGLDIKLALKTSSSFRQKLERFLANRIGEINLPMSD
jgi:hypothetical protein